MEGLKCCLEDLTIRERSKHDQHNGPKGGQSRDARCICDAKGSYNEKECCALIDGWSELAQEPGATHSRCLPLAQFGEPLSDLVLNTEDTHLLCVRGEFGERRCECEIPISSCPRAPV